MTKISIICLLVIFSLVRLDTSSGRWMIKEMANMHYYPRRDIDFIEVHVKDFIFDSFSYGKLAGM